MKSLLDQMHDQLAAENANGLEVKRWVVRRDHWTAVEHDARTKGVLVEDQERRTIFGVSVEVSDRAGSDDGILFTETGPK